MSGEVVWENWKSKESWRGGKPTPPPPPPSVEMTVCTGIYQGQNQHWKVRLAQEPRPRSEEHEYLDFSEEQMEAAAVLVLEEQFCLF